MVQWLRFCLPMQVVNWIPGQGTKIQHALGPKNQNVKQKQYCNKFNKDFKKGSISKTLLKKNLKKKKKRKYEVKA